jgi:hypothetical protein
MLAASADVPVSVLDGAALRLVARDDRKVIADRTVPAPRAG